MSMGSISKHTTLLSTGSVVMVSRGFIVFIFQWYKDTLKVVYFLGIYAYASDISRNVFPKISVNNSGIKHIHTAENSSAKITALCGAAAAAVF